VKFTFESRAQARSRGGLGCSERCTSPPAATPSASSPSRPHLAIPQGPSEPRRCLWARERIALFSVWPRNTGGGHESRAQVGLCFRETLAPGLRAPWSWARASPLGAMWMLADNRVAATLAAMVAPPPLPLFPSRLLGPQALDPCPRSGSIDVLWELPTRMEVARTGLRDWVAGRRSRCRTSPAAHRSAGPRARTLCFM
jgi:hypothetical protein